MEPAWHAYPATYADGHGTEHAPLFNDGRTLVVTIRDIHFSGKDFDALEPPFGTDPSNLVHFTLNGRDLCGCMIACDMPQVICTSTPAPGRFLGTLHVAVHLGMPARDGGIISEIVKLELIYGEWHFHSRGSGSLFETELLDLKKQLPAGHYFLNCFGCAFSDYFYGGQRLFGSMACFRECKTEYLAVRTKDDYIAMFDKNAGLVQETNICPQFQPRCANTGYRG
ncbi:MAG: DUF6304 family protein [Candidatus Sigynarchaeota archaeon]